MECCGLAAFEAQGVSHPSHSAERTWLERLWFGAEAARWPRIAGMIECVAQCACIEAPPSILMSYGCAGNPGPSNRCTKWPCAGPPGQPQACAPKATCLSLAVRLPCLWSALPLSVPTLLSHAHAQLGEALPDDAWYVLFVTSESKCISRAYLQPLSTQSVWLGALCSARMWCMF